MQQRTKEISLIICLFLFLLVVLGGGLHLSPSGALLAAVTGLLSSFMCSTCGAADLVKALLRRIGS